MKKNSALTRSLGTIAAAALALSACSADSTEGTDNSSGDQLSVTTAFYPLAFLVEEIGGEQVNITDLTPPGSDAHGVELAPRDIADLQKSDLVIYLKTLSPAIDDAVASADLSNVLNVGDHVELLTTDHLEESTGESASESDHDHGEDDEHAENDEHPEHDDHDHAEHDHGIYDPHFWTDPGRMALASEIIADSLAEADPDNAEEYKERAKALSKRLNELAGKYESTFSPSQCDATQFIVTHKAFGYMAHEYGLTQIGIAGIDPDLEPSPARIAEIKAVVDENQLNTIFTTNDGETKVANAVAEETGAKAALLDSAATQIDANKDYIQVMEDNLDALAESMGCTN